jgi:DNA (cytosine-5)-methyltransferase 1
MFPATLRLIEDAKPAAVLIENVRGLAQKRFNEYRGQILSRLHKLGYAADWKILNASSFGVPQLRPRFVLVAIKQPYASAFKWPDSIGAPPTVGAILKDLMASRGWTGAKEWALKADGIGPTIVGGSKRHGGPDLGPTRAKAGWRELGVDGHGIADEAPGSDFPVDGLPRLTLRMAARIQGFPDWWQFVGLKTSSYRQIGNAFPPPVALAVGTAIRRALLGERLVDDEAHLPSILFQVA